MMQRFVFAIASVMLFSGVLTAGESTYKLDQAGEPPEAVAKDIAAKLNETGYSVDGPDGPLCDIWLVKDVSVKPGFSPTFMLFYPFAPGQLIGALQVPEGAGYTDFRGQEMAAGVYTLRYGAQPQDGNHIGTSDTGDFLLALPAKLDQKPDPIARTDTLSQTSAKAAESTHPAIFYIVPSEETPETTSLTHDEDREFWILNVPMKAQEEGKAVTVGLRMVVAGQANE